VKQFSVLTIACVFSSAIAYAETETFENNLTVSRSIVSPSQFYQVKPGTLLELDGGATNGKVEGASPSQKLKGSDFGFGGFYAQNPSLVYGLVLKQSIGDVENGIKTTDFQISPSIAFSPSEFFTLGAQVNVLDSKSQAQGNLKNQLSALGLSTEDEDKSYTYGTLGFTVHDKNLWEASAYISNRSKDGDGEQKPQVIGTLARYRLLESLTLGLSLQHTFYNETDTEGTYKNETQYGFHLATPIAHIAQVEFDYLTYEHPSGDPAAHANEYNLLAQFSVSSSINLGFVLNYEQINFNYKDPISNDEVKGQTISEKLFIAARF
jgi:hypothetical protein